MTQTQARGLSGWARSQSAAAFGSRRSHKETRPAFSREGLAWTLSPRARRGSPRSALTALHSRRLLKFPLQGKLATKNARRQCLQREVGQSLHSGHVRADAHAAV